MCQTGSGRAVQRVQKVDNLNCCQMPIEGRKE